jgi:hypothetical protein
MNLSKTEGCVIALIVVLLGVLLLCAHQEIMVNRPRAFAAWVKLTGNPQNLTYEEWLALVSTTRNPETVPIYIYQQ